MLSERPISERHQPASGRLRSSSLHDRRRQQAPSEAMDPAGPGLAQPHSSAEQDRSDPLPDNRRRFLRSPPRSWDCPAGPFGIPQARGRRCRAPNRLALCRDRCHRGRASLPGRRWPAPAHLAVPSYRRPEPGLRRPVMCSPLCAHYPPWSAGKTARITRMSAGSMRTPIITGSMHATSGIEMRTGRRCAFSSARMRRFSRISAE